MESSSPFDIPSEPHTFSPQCIRAQSILILQAYGFTTDALMLGYTRLLTAKVLRQVLFSRPHNTDHILTPDLVRLWELFDKAEYYEC